MLAALLWDVDGTLAETERDGHRVAFNRAFAELGLPWRWDTERYGRLLRVTGGRERLLAAMADEADAPVLAGEREALARELHRLKNRCYAESVHDGTIQLRPGVAALIDEASDRGVRQAIVTTTSRATWKRCSAATSAPPGPSASTPWCAARTSPRRSPTPKRTGARWPRCACPRSATLAIEDSCAGATAARAADVPVLVTRSAYFADDPIDAAVAIGPGLHVRQGWRPVPLARPAERITLDDLVDWHERMELVSATR